MTHIYPSSGSLSGRWTLSEVVFNIKNSGWLDFPSLDDFNSGEPCTQNYTSCNPTVGPVVLDGSTDILLCNSQSVLEAVPTVVPHPSGDPVPSPLTALIPKTGRTFFKLYPNGHPKSGRLDINSILCGAMDDRHTRATKDINVWTPTIAITCGSGTVTAVSHPPSKLPTNECFSFVEEYSGIYSFIEPTVQYTPSGWIFSHNAAVNGLKMAYHPTFPGESSASPTLINLKYIAHLNPVHSGELQFRWRRIYEDWTISEQQIFFTGNLVIPPNTDCGLPQSGSSQSGVVFFQNMLGGSTTVSGMSYVQRSNCADGTDEYYYEGVVPYDHPIWSNVTVDTAYTNALTAAGKHWGLKMIHAYSSGHWFAPDGTPSFFEPVGSNTKWNTYIPLHCNDVNSVPNHPFEYTDLHDNPTLGARGNDDILYTANTNCSNLSLDAVTAGSPGSSQGGKTTYLNANATGVVLGFQNPMPTNLYRQKQTVELIEYNPTGNPSVQGGCCSPTPCPTTNSVLYKSSNQAALSGSVYYYNSHINTGTQLNTGGTWVDHEFCYKMAGRCNIDNVIQVGSCGLCAGLSHTAYCYGVGSHHSDGDGDGISNFAEYASVSPTFYLEITQALSAFSTASAVPSGVGQAYIDGDTDSGAVGYEWPDGTFLYGSLGDASSNGNYCNESIGGEQVTYTRPYPVSLGTSSVYGENISNAGPQSCLKKAKELWEAAGSPSGARYDIAWYSAGGYSDLPIHYDNSPIQETGVYPPTAPAFLYGDNRPGSMGGAAYKPFGEYYYTTSSCHAAIQKIHQYDSTQKLLSRDYGTYAWTDYPPFTGPLPVPHSASSDEEKGHVTVTPVLRSALYGQAWVQWYPHLLGLDARNYGGNRSDDAISGLPPENICDVLDLIHETDNEKGCSELESIYGSGVVWTSGAYDAIDCGGSPPWNCGGDGFGEAICPDVIPICGTGNPIQFPIDIGLNFTVSCREVDTSFYSLSPTQDIKFEALSTYSPSCNTAGLNLLSINSVSGVYSTDLTENEWGVTIDIDRPYTSTEGQEAYNNDFPGKTTFSLWYVGSRWANSAVPVISGMWYDTSAAGVNDRFLITRQSSADALRDWTCKNLRFARKTGTGASSVLTFSWPFNDLYFGYCSGTDIPINLVPC